MVQHIKTGSLDLIYIQNFFNKKECGNILANLTHEKKIFSETDFPNWVVTARNKIAECLVNNRISIPFMDNPIPNQIVVDYYKNGNEHSRYKYAGNKNSLTINGGKKTISIMACFGEPRLFSLSRPRNKFSMPEPGIMQGDILIMKEKTCFTWKHAVPRNRNTGQSWLITFNFIRNSF